MTIERDEVEASDEVIAVERQARAGFVISIRLSADEAARLENVADVRKLSLTQVAREALDLYLRTAAGS